MDWNFEVPSFRSSEESGKFPSDINQPYSYQGTKLNTRRQINKPAATKLLTLYNNLLFMEKILILWNRRMESVMARPIKETPILKGSDARRFVERMKQSREESEEKKERRLANYRLAMRILVKK